AALFTRNVTRATGPLAAGTPQTGVIAEAITEQRLALVDVVSETLREISPDDMYVYEYDWSPDGQRFVTTAAHGSGGDNWYIAELYTIDVTTGVVKSIYKPPLQIANPAWSPDGRRIAFIAGLMSDEGVIGNDIYTCGAAGGEVENVTTNMKASAAWLDWMSDGHTILFAEYTDGEAGVATLDVSDHTVTALWKSAEQVSSGNWGMTLSV